jgi:hypothetical protein
MVYNTRKLCVFVLKNTMFRKMDLFPSSGEGMQTHTLLGLLEKARLNLWTSFVSPFIIPDDGQGPKTWQVLAERPLPSQKDSAPLSQSML